MLAQLEKSVSLDNATPKNDGSYACRIMSAIKRKGYKLIEDGKPYNMNIIGVRSVAVGDRNYSTENHAYITNKFDDELHIFFVNKFNELEYYTYPITTDSGTFYSKKKNFFDEKGVAILVPGQYENAFNIGKHGGAYDALCQCQDLSVWRDDDEDKCFTSSEKIDVGRFAIQIHRSSGTGTSKIINNWSAGCQVFANITNFNEFMSFCKLSQRQPGRGDKFTYTLLNKSDIN